ncbi:MAG: xanthine dehydrogenase family protein subunit M [Dehalococcoidia bacterium]
MIDFQYHNAGSLEEVFDLLETHGDNARVMAGGTALVIMMKQRLAQPEHVVSLRRIPGLANIQESQQVPGGVEIGPLCTQRAMEVSPLMRERLPLVAYAYSRIATPRIRHMATVGGGLVHGDPSQDPPPSLIALGASVVMTSASGQRQLPVEELYLDYYETDVKPGEVLTSLVIPPAPPGSGAAYLKFLPRTADDYATVSAAAVVTRTGDNLCEDLRLVLGSVGVTPVRAVESENLLRGQPLTDENIRAAAAAVKDVIDPLDDYRGSADYKREMAEVFARRAIEKALEGI